jgi:hypothetical protein
MNQLFLITRAMGVVGHQTPAHQVKAEVAAMPIQERKIFLAILVDVKQWR